MSAKASAYAQELVVCPNGDLISRGEKLALMVLADSHQAAAGRFTYPSVATMAPLALCDPRTFRRHLDGLERKGVIRRLRPPAQGRGMQVFYFFCELDELPEGWQNATLLWSAQRVAKGGQKEGKRRAEGGRKGDILSDAYPTVRARELELELEQKQETPPNPPSPGGACEGEPKTLFVVTTETAPPRPQEGGSVRSEVEPRLDDEARAATAGELQAELSPELLRDAVRQLMAACGLAEQVDRRLPGVLESVLRREVSESSLARAPALAEAVVRMSLAWEEYSETGEALRFRWGARKFFGHGYWRSQEGWPWDAVVLREQRLRREMGTGYWRGE